MAWNFRLFGTPIKVEPAFFLVAAVLGASALPNLDEFFIWIAVVTFSILWHEFGHVVAFRAFGRPSTIELWSLGGLTRPEPSEGDRPAADIVVYLAGPAAGLLLGAVVYLATAPKDTLSPLLETTVNDLLWVNIYWSLFNLLPLLPLDGGGALAATLRAVFKGREGRAAHFISLIVAGGGVLYGIVARDYWIAFLAVWAGAYNAPHLTKSQGRTEERRQPESGPQRIEWMQDGLDALEKGDLKGAARIAHSKLRPSADQRHLPRAGLLLMWAHLLRGRIVEGASVANEYLDEALVQPVVHGSIAEAAGDGGQALELLRRSFEARPTHVTNRLLVVGLVEHERFDEATRALFDDRVGSPDETASRVLHLALVQQSRWEEAADFGRRVLKARDDAFIAYNTACSCAQLDRNDEAVTLLEKAIDWGFNDVAQMDSDPDLESLRDDASYRRLRANLARE
jgi:Zn-dependent protease